MNYKSKKRILIISTLFVLIMNIIYIFQLYFGVINLESFGDTFPISNESQMLILVFCALVNTVAMFFIIKNPINNKKKLITLNVLQILFGTIYNIISGVLNIVILCRKTSDLDIEGETAQEQEKKELPILEDITKYKWYVYFIIFVFLFIICYTPALDLLPIPDDKTSVLISIILLYIIQFSLLVIPMWNELKRDFIVFKNNFGLYLSKMLPQFGIITIIYLICNLSLISLVGNIPTNQAILTSWPIYITALLAIIIAPIIEELMFRGFIRKFIRNDILFVIISTLIFGALHVTVSDSIEQFLFIIPYSLLGLAFSLNYVRTKNIASNIFLHSAWNSIGVIGMLILG